MTEYYSGECQVREYYSKPTELMSFLVFFYVFATSFHVLCCLKSITEA